MYFHKMAKLMPDYDDNAEDDRMEAKILFHLLYSRAILHVARFQFELANEMLTRSFEMVRGSQLGSEDWTQWPHPQEDWDA